MKSIRIATSLMFLLCTAAAVAQSDAKATYERLQSLNGTWEGKADGDSFKVVFRPTAGGSAIMSEIIGKNEDMISMFHMDNDRVLMTHYCTAGNQPRMEASMSPDGRTVTFAFVDGTNIAGPKAGHMQQMVLTMLDADHHIEDWTFVQDGRELKKHFELARAKATM